MNEERDEDASIYDLVMPFVVCDDNGGPYEASAFVAGCRYTTIDHALRTIVQFGIIEYQHYVEPQLLPQLDLLAMHYGWKLTSEPWEEHPDEWTLASFEKLPEMSVGEPPEGKQK